MSHDLRDQLESYGAYVHDRQEAVSASEILEDAPQPIVLTPVRTPRRRWVGAVAGAAIALAVIGGVGLLRGEPDQTPGPAGAVTTVPLPTEPQGTLAPEPSTTITPAAPVAFSADGWQLHTGPIDVLGSEMVIHISEIVENEGVLIAVGSVADERERPVVWQSVDGVSWTRTFIGSGEDWIFAVARGGPGLVAVGGHRYSGSTPFWISADGSTWEEVRTSLPDMKDVVSFDGRLLAVASYSHEDSSESRQFESPLVFESTDGVNWTGVPRSNFEQPSGGRIFELNAIASNGDVLAAYGEIASGDFRYSGFWTSTDGTNWSLASSPSLCCQLYPYGSASSALAANGEGFIAHRTWGSGEENTDVLLFSADGSQWEVVLELDETSAMQIRGVTATEEGFIAVGSDHRLERGIIWTSPDGVTWTWTGRDLLDDISPDGVWPTGDGVIVIGSQGEECSFLNDPVGFPDCPPARVIWSSASG